MEEGPSSCEVITSQGLIVSFPKSGRTWLRVILCRALAKHYGFPDERCLYLERITAAAGLPTVAFTHDDAATDEWYSQLSRDKGIYAGKRIVFLVRDPRDILVSYFFHKTKRFAASWALGLSDFVRSPFFGIRKILSFYQIWWQASNVPLSFSVCKYEDLHKDALLFCQQVLSWLGLPSVPDGVLSEAIEFASFDNLKKLEAQNWFGNKVLRPANPDDQDSYKTRRGVVGGYRDYLTEEDLRYVNAKIARSKCPLLRDYRNE